MNGFPIWSLTSAHFLTSSRYQPRSSSYLQTRSLMPLTSWSPASGHTGLGRGKGVCLLVWRGRGKGSKGDGEGHSMLALRGSGAKVAGSQHVLRTSPPFFIEPQEKCHPVVQRRKLCPQEAKQLAQGQDRGTGRPLTPSCVSHPPAFPLTSHCSTQGFRVPSASLHMSDESQKTFPTNTRSAGRTGRSWGPPTR